MYYRADGEEAHLLILFCVCVCVGSLLDVGTRRTLAGNSPMHGAGLYRAQGREDARHIYNTHQHCKMNVRLVIFYALFCCNRAPRALSVRRTREQTHTHIHGSARYFVLAQASAQATAAGWHIVCRRRRRGRRCRCRIVRISAAGLASPFVCSSPNRLFMVLMIKLRAHTLEHTHASTRARTLEEACVY